VVSTREEISTAGTTTLSAAAGGGDGGAGTLAPAFPDGTGQQAHGAKAYPAGPYGVGKGSIIANYKFVGYANAQKINNALQAIELADLYNPTGDGVFEEGSVMEVGAPKPKRACRRCRPMPQTWRKAPSSPT